jgi:hypothetical protein
MNLLAEVKKVGEFIYEVKLNGEVKGVVEDTLVGWQASPNLSDEDVRYFDEMQYAVEYVVNYEPKKLF